MPRYFYVAATIIVLALGGSATAFAQYTQTIGDAKPDVRTWGPEANGLALSIGVDKTTYVVGDVVRLDAAFWNIHASEAMTLPFCNRLELTVRNTQGGQFVQHDADISCDSYGPIRPCRPVVAPGDIVKSQSNLAAFRLPPGTYTVTAGWTAYTYLKDPKSETCLGPSGTLPFYVHSNPVTISVVASEQP
jgi:hypothetical protein